MAKTRTNKEGYMVFEDSGKLVHRWAIQKKHGIEVTEDLEVHHLNHDRKDNSKQNLILLKKEDHYDLHEYEKKRDFMLKGILFFAIVIQIMFSLQVYFNQPINVPSAMLFGLAVILLTFELLTHFFERKIRRPKDD